MRPRYIPEEGPKHKWWLERHEAKLAEAKALGKEPYYAWVSEEAAVILRVPIQTPKHPNITSD